MGAHPICWQITGSQVWGRCTLLLILLLLLLLLLLILLLRPHTSYLHNYSTTTTNTTTTTTTTTAHHVRAMAGSRRRILQRKGNGRGRRHPAGRGTQDLAATRATAALVWQCGTSS